MLNLIWLHLVNQMGRITINRQAHGFVSSQMQLREASLSLNEGGGGLRRSFGESYTKTLVRCKSLSERRSDLPVHSDEKLNAQMRSNI